MPTTIGAYGKPLVFSRGFFFSFLFPSFVIHTSFPRRICYDGSMNDRKGLWVWVGVAVVVIAIAWGGVYWFMHRSGPQAAAPLPVHAPAGQVVAGFPQDLVPGPSSTSSTNGTPGILAGITNSYSINYSSSTNQYTAEWVSASSTATLYTAYTAYVTKNGWTITNHMDSPSLKGVYAVNASSSLNIVITPQPSAQGRSKVSVTYVSGMGQ